MATVDLTLREQYSISGAGTPYTFNFPAGSSTVADPTGFRNIGPQAESVTMNAAAGEFFWITGTQAQVASTTVTVLPNSSVMLVYRDTKGWVPYFEITQINSLFKDDTTAIVPTLTPGDTYRIELETLGTLNPSTDWAIVGVNNDRLQALRPMRVIVNVAGGFSFTGINNTEINYDMQIISVVGAVIGIQIPMRDAFQTSRIGTWVRNWNLPSAIITVATGDEIAFDLTNSATSTMDLDLTGAFVVIEPR